MKKSLFRSIAVVAIMFSMSAFAAVDHLKPSGINLPCVNQVHVKPAPAPSLAAVVDVAAIHVMTSPAIETVNAERIPEGFTVVAALTGIYSKQVGIKADREAEGRSRTMHLIV